MCSWQAQVHEFCMFDCTMYAIHSRAWHRMDMYVPTGGSPAVQRIHDRPNMYKAQPQCSKRWPEAIEYKVSWPGGTLICFTVHNLYLHVHVLSSSFALCTALAPPTGVGTMGAMGGSCLHNICSVGASLRCMLHRC